MKSLKDKTQSQKATQPQANGSVHRLLDTEHVHVPNLNGSGRPSLPDHCPLWGHSIFPVYGYMYVHHPYRPHLAEQRSALPHLVHNRLLPGGGREGEDEPGHLPNTLHSQGGKLGEDQAFAWGMAGGIFPACPEGMFCHFSKSSPTTFLPTSTSIQGHLLQDPPIP